LPNKIERRHQPELSDGLDEVITAELLPHFSVANRFVYFEGCRALGAFDQSTLRIFQEQHELLELHAFQVECHSHDLSDYLTSFFIHLHLQLRVELVYLLKVLVLIILMIYASVYADMEEHCHGHPELNLFSEAIFQVSLRQPLRIQAMALNK